MNQTRQRQQSDIVYYASAIAVRIPPRAEVAREFRPGGHYEELVAVALSDALPLTDAECIYTASELDRYMPLQVVGRSYGARITWARHAGHTAANPGLSPFVHAEPHGQPLTRALTIQLVRTETVPLLVRAYAGDAQPPLPWMKSAADYEGGVDACAAYWRRHAYIAQYDAIVRGTQTMTPPDWAR